jgi:hypothetical protein
MWLQGPFRSIAVRRQGTVLIINPTRLVRSQDLSLLCWLQIQHPDFCLDADDFAFWFDMGDEI